jgi:hypothetical protein
MDFLHKDKPVANGSPQKVNPQIQPFKPFSRPSKPCTFHLQDDEEIIDEISSVAKSIGVGENM